MTGLTVSFIQLTCHETFPHYAQGFSRFATPGMIPSASTSLVVVIIGAYEVLRLFRPQSLVQSSGDGGDANHTDTYTYDYYYYEEQPGVNLYLLEWVLRGALFALLLLVVVAFFFCCKRAKPRRQGLRIRLDGK